MLTISQLAKRCGLTRTSVLYYERQGLLSPKCRSANGYRYYGPEQQQRLERILALRSLGVSVSAIGRLLDANAADDTQLQLLQQQFDLLELEIQQRRKQQRAIVERLAGQAISLSPPMDKQRWVEVMRQAGFDESAMRQWHIAFEAREPEQHARFLLSLGLDEQQVAKIRAWSL